MKPRRVERTFRAGQLLSAAAYSLGHGGNDAQKTIGVICAVMVASGLLPASATGAPSSGWIFRVVWRDGVRHRDRRLAHRQDHGHGPHTPESRRWVLRRGRRRDHAVHRSSPQDSGIDDAHHHRRDRRRWLGDESCAACDGAWRHASYGRGFSRSRWPALSEQRRWSRLARCTLGSPTQLAGRCQTRDPACAPWPSSTFVTARWTPPSR